MKRALVVFMAAVAVLVLAVTNALAFPAVEVYKSTSPAVLLIVSSSGGGGGSTVGAGSVISKDGLVITNAHVVVNARTRRPYAKVSAYTRPQEVTGDFQSDLKHRHKVRVLDYDKDLDLALLKVEGVGESTGIIYFADPKGIMVGEEVVAIGHPEQGGLWSLTYGRISGQMANQGKVRGKNVYQTDTSVNRGNSGGPLLDKRGYMVGVNTNIARRGSGDLAITGVNFALKSSVVTKWLKKRQGLNIAYGSAPLGGVPMVASVDTSPKAAPVVEKAVEAAPPRLDEPAEPEATHVSTPPELEPVEESAEKPVRSDTILTPKKPYKAEDLYEAVAKEMEDIMMDMKQKFKRKRR